MNMERHKRTKGNGRLWEEEQTRGGEAPHLQMNTISNVIFLQL
jgi:hypothetical protein